MISSAIFNKVLLLLGMIGYSENFLADNFLVQEVENSDLSEISTLFDNNPDISQYTGINVYDFNDYFKLKKNQTKMYICRDTLNQKIVGFLISYQMPNSYYVRAIGVDKDYRRYGVATRLLQAVYSYANQNDYLHITIHASNENAEKCYKKFGFKENVLAGYLAMDFIKNK